jgi:hypothetical protein
LPNGRNEIPIERPSRMKILLRKFWGLIPWMLARADGDPGGRGEKAL